MRNLELTRPLAFFDLETTGIDPQRDKIVEIAVVRVDPGGSSAAKTRRIDPERPIPPEATAVHGIRDEDVAGAPTFRQVARGILDFLADSDLAGFNVRRFDVPLLDREFRDCGLDLALTQRRVIDAMSIFHRKEPRDLAAAVKHFLGREHAGAHGAAADVAATVEVLDAELARYPDLPRTVAALEDWCHPVPDGAVDRGGKFVLREGVVVFGFGRQRGRPLSEVARLQRDYLEWILKQDFPDDARALVERALRGEP
ncbi:MAG TPA: 3'-5' exonuclease [Candidatus Polarisedimenticolaceae bacterium]|nr:3'-5' exonuclease [Candidatus Polarisedimenticolaceae bacterium]